MIFLHLYPVPPFRTLKVARIQMSDGIVMRNSGAGERIGNEPRQRAGARKQNSETSARFAFEKLECDGCDSLCLFSRVEADQKMRAFLSRRTDVPELRGNEVRKWMSSFRYFGGLVDGF